MNPTGATFTVLACLFVVWLPRRMASIPLLLTAAYMTTGQVLHLGPANFTVLRIVVFFAFVRIVLRRERIAGGMNAVDWALLLWASCLLFTSAFHQDGTLVYRAGTVWSEIGCYFAFRVFLADADDVTKVFKAACWLLLPLALLMLFEKFGGHNPFSHFGGVDATPYMRQGQVRANGPFSHAILAGTVGASLLAMTFALWVRHRRHAIVGACVATSIVFASTSSSPLLMTLFIFLGFAFWAVRRQLALVRWSLLAGIVALDAVMNDPFYFLIARIDLTGGSQSYYRAQLIRSSLEHLDEWWLVGTDYTRHWMATGLSAYSKHADIVNHYIAMGVLGGLPLLAIFVLVLACAFRGVGVAIREQSAADLPARLLGWSMGALLFGHTMNFLSISLHDQSTVFFYLCLAAIGAVARTSLEPARRTSTAMHALTRRPQTFKDAT